VISIYQMEASQLLRTTGHQKTYDASTVHTFDANTLVPVEQKPSGFDVMFVSLLNRLSASSEYPSYDVQHSTAQ